MGSELSISGDNLTATSVPSRSSGVSWKDKGSASQTQLNAPWPKERTSLNDLVPLITLPSRVELRMVPGSKGIVELGSLCSGAKGDGDDTGEMEDNEMGETGE